MIKHINLDWNPIEKRCDIALSDETLQLIYEKKTIFFSLQKNPPLIVILLLLPISAFVRNIIETLKNRIESNSDFEFDFTDEDNRVEFIHKFSRL